MSTTPKDVNEKLGMMKTVVGAMKPMVILPVGAMKPSDIKRLNDNGLCVVEAKNPATVRFTPSSSVSLKVDGVSM